MCDTGIGVPASRLPMLFKAFSQVENSTTRKYGGTGLGLAICQSLVQLMGGTIWVDTEEGKGSNFQFTMTTSCHDPMAVSCVNMVADQRERRPSLRPGLRVLLVQDQSACAEILMGNLLCVGCYLCCSIHACASLCGHSRGTGRWVCRFAKQQF